LNFAVLGKFQNFLYHWELFQINFWTLLFGVFFVVKNVYQLEILKKLARGEALKTGFFSSCQSPRPHILARKNANQFKFLENLSRGDP
jgi:hypothetical protein